MAGSGKAKLKKHQGKFNEHAPKPNLQNQLQQDGLSSLDECGIKTLPHSDSDEKNSQENFGFMKKLPTISSSTSITPLKAGNVNFGELEKLDFIKFSRQCPNGMDSRDYLIINLTEKLKYLTTLIKQWGDSATNIMIETSKRFNDSKDELRKKRLQNNERESLLKQKEELDSFSLMLTEKEKYIRMVNRELYCVNEAINEVDVQKSCTLKSQEALFQAQKRETEIVKLSKQTEKQICELKRQFAEDRRKIVELEQKLKQYNEDHEHAKATPSNRW